MRLNIMYSTSSILSILATFFNAQSAPKKNALRTYRLRYAPMSSKKRTTKTYNSKYSLMVTHLTTNLPASCLYSAERTGSVAITKLLAIITPKITVYGDISLGQMYPKRFFSQGLPRQRGAPHAWANSAALPSILR